MAAAPVILPRRPRGAILAVFPVVVELEKVNECNGKAERIS